MPLRLLDIVHNDEKLYLIFEFLDLDLKKYMDTTAPFGLAPNLIKVSRGRYLMCVLMVACAFDVCAESVTTY